MTDQNYIHDFFHLLDEFLLIQFNATLGTGNKIQINDHYQKILHFLKSPIELPKLDEARRLWINHLTQMTPYFGFPDLSKSKEYTILQSFRAKHNFKNLTPYLQKRTETALQHLNEELPLHEYKDWFSNTDIDISFHQDINTFVKNLLKKAKINPERLPTLEFFNSPNNRFFNIHLNLKSECHIAHGPLNSLYRLTTFCHEIGHFVDIDNISLEEKFLTIKNETEPTIANETPAYKLEKVFMENLDLLDDINPAQIDLFSSRIKEWKKYKFYLDTISSYMCFLYFSGESFDCIENEFSTLIQKIDHKNTSLKWTDLTNLAFPLSKLGYVDAYLNVFLN